MQTNASRISQSMTITRNHNGSYTISTIASNRYVHQTYYGYTKADAKTIFRHWLKQQGLTSRGT
jgi:Holliday junction resolvasome RuvABC DNA-binding subunit